MRKTQPRNRRLVRLVGAMKRGEYPNARSLARQLAQSGRGAPAPCSRTLQRDIEYLRLELNAPVDYEPRRHGYYLRDPDWALPLEELRGDLLYASLLGKQLALAIVPPPLHLSLETALRAQLAAALPEEVDADLLRAVVFATGSQPSLEPQVFETVHAAWRETRRLRLLYRTDGEADGQWREVDIHALFLAQGAWYARAFCHLRQNWRSLALHRIAAADLLDQRFERSTQAIEQVRSGNVFDYATVRDAVVECQPDKARLLAERIWFPGQQSEPLADGALRLSFPTAPRPELLWWVLSYAGSLEVVAPADLREEVHQAATHLARRHRPTPVTPPEAPPPAKIAPSAGNPRPPRYSTVAGSRAPRPTQGQRNRKAKP